MDFLNSLLVMQFSITAYCRVTSQYWRNVVSDYPIILGCQLAHGLLCPALMRESLGGCSPRQSRSLWEERMFVIVCWLIAVSPTWHNAKVYSCTTGKRMFAITCWLLILVPISSFFSLERCGWTGTRAFHVVLAYSSCKGGRDGWCIKGCELCSCCWWSCNQLLMLSWSCYLALQWYLCASLHVTVPLFEILGILETVISRCHF